MSDALMPLLWVAVSLLVLLLLQRWIHTHLHGVSLLATGRADWAVIVYAVILFPGVLLHEVSHWLAATLLGVRTGKMSLIPRRQKDGTLQLGYVEYYKSSKVGPIRESLIGAAPLITGTLAILLIGLRIFGVTELAAAVQTGDLDILAAALTELFATPFIFLWIYLIFAISNAMLPSRSDRKAWPAFLLIMGALVLFLYLIGLQDTLFQRLEQPVITVFGYLGIALSLSIGVDILFVLAIALLESLLSRVRGMSVVYGPQGAEESPAG
jgi:hypothetical protein